MLSLLTTLSLFAAPVQDSAHVVVVATTDVHGRAVDWDYPAGRPFAGGLTRVATVVDSLRAQYPGQVVLVDAGDMIQGNAFAAYFAREAPRDPHPIIEAMNLTGYDVVTPGNHDFDWGLPVLREAISGAAFPYVSGNIYTLAGDTLLHPPFVVLRRQGVRIGVTGFTTPGAMVWNRDQLREKLRIERIPRAAISVMRSLRRVSDLAIVVTHSGMDGPASYDTTGIGAEHAAATLASLPARPDLVVVGHSHREMRDSVLNGIHFVQPRPFAGSITVTHIDLVRLQGRWRPARIRSDLVSLALVPPSDRLALRLASAHGAVRQWVNTPIGEAAVTMQARGARAGPTPLLDFIHAVQRKHSGADLSAASAFDLAAGFDSGTIQLGQAFRLYPYENTLRAIRISGASLRQYLEHSARYFQTDAVGRVSLNDSVPGYNFDVVAGARYEIDLRRPVGDRIQNLRVRGRAVAPADSFTLALNSYRQTGAGGYTMVRGAPVVYDRAESIRDLLIEEIRSRKRLGPSDFPASEWRIVPEGAALAVERLFRIARPAVHGPRDSVLLRILATTDLHGSLLPKTRSGGRRSGGLAALKAVMDSLADECGCAGLRLDAGDQMQGTFVSNSTAGRSVVEVLNHLGVTAAAIGNHEFDWSVDTLRQRMSQARYSWLSANIFDSISGKRPDWAVPYRMLEAGGLSVAVIGYTTAEAKRAVKPRQIRGLRFDEGVLPLHDVLTEVRSLRPDLTVILAHAGAECDGLVCSGEAIRMADALPARAVDLIIGGHTHDTVNTRVAGVPIVQAGVWGGTVGVADLVETAAGGREVRTRIVSVSPDSVTEDWATAELIQKFQRRADSITSQVVATLKFPLVQKGDQHRLGGLIAEARRNVLRADMGFVINGGIRGNLPAGPINYGQLFEVQPFENSLLKLTLTGRQVFAVLEHALDARGRPTAHVAGVKAYYDPRRPSGKRVRRVELPGGRRLQRDGSYTMAVDDFVATGGEGYTMLKGLPAQPGGMLDIEALITHLKRLPQPIAISGAGGFVAARR